MVIGRGFPPCLRYLFRGWREETGGEADDHAERKNSPLGPGKKCRRSSRFSPPPPHHRPTVLPLLSKSIRRFTCFHVGTTSLARGVPATCPTSPPFISVALQLPADLSWPAFGRVAFVSRRLGRDDHGCWRIGPGRTCSSTDVGPHVRRRPAVCTARSRQSAAHVAAHIRRIGRAP